LATPERRMEMKVLVVDDSKIMRAIVIKTIKETGLGEHEIVQAENGVEALAAMKGFTPDLIMSDWNMPSMTGIDFLKALREAGDATRFVFVTSEGTPEMRAAAAAAGAETLIEKPFTAAMFKSIMDGVLR
jgi:two-component system, chemotaxis family, chemotaxis protein CheY